MGDKAVRIPADALLYWQRATRLIITRQPKLFVNRPHRQPSLRRWTRPYATCTALTVESNTLSRRCAISTP